MPLQLDHIFVCCDSQAPEAEALLSLGLKEGSGNVHPGQGTANRRFFFHGGFLELLWVADPNEAQSKLTAPTRLWERWSQRRSGTCPFGIAFSPTGIDTPESPFESWAYNPKYLPPDKRILFATGTDLQEPELFYLAWPNTAGTSMLQPRDHLSSFVRLTSASVGLPNVASLSEPSRVVQSAGLLSFYESEQYELTLEFQSEEALHVNLGPTLPVILRSAGESAA